MNGDGQKKNKAPPQHQAVTGLNVIQYQARTLDCECQNSVYMEASYALQARNTQVYHTHTLMSIHVARQYIMNTCT